MRKSSGGNSARRLEVTPLPSPSAPPPTPYAAVRNREVPLFHAGRQQRHCHARPNRRRAASPQGGAAERGEALVPTLRYGRHRAPEGSAARGQRGGRRCSERAEDGDRRRSAGAARVAVGRLSGVRSPGARSEAGLHRATLERFGVGAALLPVLL